MATLRFMIMVHNDGITDMDFRDGDIFHAGDESWNPSPIELQKYLCVEIPNVRADIEELLSSDYGVGPGSDPVIRRIRKYRLDYVTKFNQEELAIIRNETLDFPLVTGRFIESDIIRKG